MIKVGTCGWSAKGGRRAYFKHFSVIELQETFYKLPREETASRWRSEAPEGFEFVVKAWQAITHPPTSPTWQRSGLRIPEGAESRYGYFRVSDETLDAWQRTLRICRALEARVCVLQTPPSFGYSAENIGNVEAFFTTIDRGGLLLGWEPRGTWNENLGSLRSLLAKLDITHVVDPLRRKPIHLAGFAYFRLHGLGPGETSYHYRYTDEDLDRLSKIVVQCPECMPTYVLFNNVFMFDDAKRFKTLLKDLGATQV